MFGCVKKPWLFLGVSLMLSAVAQAGLPGRGSVGSSFHIGTAVRGPGAVRGRFNGGGFQNRFIAHRDIDDRRFSFRRPVFFQQYAWPVYWYPYGDPLAYSYLDPDSQSDYECWDNSGTSVQPQAANRAAPQNPVIVVINAGNQRPTESGAPLISRGAEGGYVNYGYIPANGIGQQRTVEPDPNEHTAPDPKPPGDPVTPQATPVPQQMTPTPMQMGTGPFGKFVIVSYLQNGGKDVIFVKNIETNAVQRITSQPNVDHFRIVELHPSANLTQFEAIISNGADQGPVRFQF